MYIQKMGPVLVKLAKEMAEKQESESKKSGASGRSAEGQCRTPSWFFGSTARKFSKPK